MKRYQFHWFIRVFWTLLFSASTAVLCYLRLYWFAGVFLLILSWFVYQLFLFQERNTKDMERLTEAIRFSEFNISFQNFVGKGLAPELVPKMEASVAYFGQKLKDRIVEQNFYETLLMRIDFGLLVLDQQKNIHWSNKTALDIQSVLPEIPEILDKLIPGETKIIRIEQEKNIYQLAATAIYFISEGRKLKLISLKNIQSVLEESESDAWKKLIRVLTHEIMNSLAPIISLSETLSERNEEDPALLNRSMQIIHRRSKGLVDFVNNYKKLTNIPQSVIARFSARDWIGDIYHLLKADGFRFDYVIQPEEMQIEADRGLMEQVLINLIKNACESGSPENPAVVKVSISKNEYQRTIIKVSDTGEGILPEVIDKIFVPFFTTKANGSGIGLSICRQIVNLHGGSISVQSEPEKGSYFTLQI